MALTTGLHAFFDDNQPDRDLGNVAYGLGSSLRKRTVTIINRTNPRAVFPEQVDEKPSVRAARISGIAEVTRSSVCD